MWGQEGDNSAGAKIYKIDTDQSQIDHRTYFSVIISFSGARVQDHSEITLQSLQTRMSSPAKVMNPDNEVIIHEICDYATNNQVRDMLQEYMRRLIVEQPKEPLKYLIKEITENPFVVTPKEGETETEKEAVSEEKTQETVEETAAA